MNGHLEGEKPPGFLGTKTNHCSSPLNWDDPPSSQPWFTFWSFASVLWFRAFARIHWKRQSLGNGREVGLLFAMFFSQLEEDVFFYVRQLGFRDVPLKVRFSEFLRDEKKQLGSAGSIGIEWLDSASRVFMVFLYTLHGLDQTLSSLKDTFQNHSRTHWEVDKVIPSNLIWWVLLIFIFPFL